MDDRRDRIKEFLIKGYSQEEISKALRISQPTCMLLISSFKILVKVRNIYLGIEIIRFSFNSGNLSTCLKISIHNLYLLVFR